MKTLELDTNDRFAYWDALIAQANAAFKKESVIIYESLRELARNQRVVAARLASSENQNDNMFCDVIQSSKVELIEKIEIRDVIRMLVKHDTFGVTLKAQIDGSDESASPLEYGFITFTHIGDNTPEIRSNLDTSEGAATVDRQVMDSLTSVLRGGDQLAFMYTPYVMAITRLLSVDLNNVRVDARSDVQAWDMEAIAGDYVVTTRFDFGKVCDYFNL